MREPPLKRRGFLGAGATALAGAALPPARGQPTPAPPHERHPVGEFVLERSGLRLWITHRRDPQRVLWEGAPDGRFLVAERARARIRSFGTPEGAYAIRDAVEQRFERPSIDAITAGAATIAVSGRLHGQGDGIDYTLRFEAVSATHLRFEIGTSGAAAAGVNRIRLRLASTRDEAFFGFGQQLTQFDQKGHLLPILVQEHGVGRGRAVVTQLVDVFANRGGGTPYITEAPAPHFISSRLRSLCLENTEYSEFDLRPTDSLQIKVWSGVMTGRILQGDAPLDLIEAYTEYAGRMRRLPDWVHRGAIVSVQGGTRRVREKLDALRRADIALAALWIQDWTGVRVTSAGRQLWWDWKLDRDFYPGWQQLVDDLERDGARMLTYLNPFLSTEAGHDALFMEAREKDYLVRRADGTAYLIRNTSFDAGLVDLSNPEARRWIKQIIRTEMIGRTGVSGWMHDFGEALPFDGWLHGGADPAVWHNRYPVEWARVAREAIDEAGRGDDIVFFDRSAFTRSPGVATLFWLGDQLQSWDGYDGIKTAVVGLLSGGVSGFSLLHSDAGGYVVLKLDVAGRHVPVIARTPELLMRWIELNAFTAVLRTHEGLDPADSAQFDTSAETLAQLRRFARVYRGLGAYRKRLVADAADRGHPLVRSLFLHHPDDANTHALRHQFLLGPDLLVAPVLDPGVETVEVYFPQGSEWIDLWSGADAGLAGEWMRMPAPIGRPAVFLRKGAASAREILDGLAAAGVLA